MTGPSVSFIVPVRNDAERLRVALGSIARNEYPPELIEIIVADNGSIDDSVAVARAHRTVVLELPGETVSALRNAAAKVARGSVLAFVDADHEIADTWTDAAVQILSDARIGATGALCLPPRNANWVQRVYDCLRRRRDGQRDTEWLGSGNLAMRKDIFMETGGFDQTLVTCEDVDLCQRIKARGYRVVSDSRLKSVHHGDPATLGALFLGELWRGRDNLRVSLRHPRSWRSLASLGLSCGLLLGLVLVFSATLLPTVDPRVAALGGAMITALFAFRTLLLIRQQRTINLLGVSRTLAVAAVYELGRALALIVRLPHRQRQTSNSAPLHV